MKLVETTISEGSVRLRMADDAGPLKANEWADVRVPLSGLKHRDGSPIGRPERQQLLEVQIAVLHHVRVVINAEIDRLGVLAGSNPAERR